VVGPRGEISIQNGKIGYLLYRICAYGTVTGAPLMERKTFTGRSKFYGSRTQRHEIGQQERGILFILIAPIACARLTLQV
jgi:hypothetical protein